MLNGNLYLVITLVVSMLLPVTKHEVAISVHPRRVSLSSNARGEWIWAFKQRTEYLS